MQNLTCEILLRFMSDNQVADNQGLDNQGSYNQGSHIIATA